LMASGQWLLAPTDLSGNNPRPVLRPHVVNNSWSGPPGDPFYQGIVQAGVSAGIFPVFAAGNSGPACGTAGSPGDYPESYAVGAFGMVNNIASFSSRGGSAAFGTTKPNITAPGESVRSAVPHNGYTNLNGTSMATPHVAGAVALMWSAAPALTGDIDQTRAILDQTAIDVSDLSCGGTAQNNNVWGEGRLMATVLPHLASHYATLASSYATSVRSVGRESKGDPQMQIDGKTGRDFPRLAHGGRHLEDDQGNRGRRLPRDRDQLRGRYVRGPLDDRAAKERHEFIIVVEPEIKVGMPLHTLISSRDGSVTQ
jgi:hypothetical protein